VSDHVAGDLDRPERSLDDEFALAETGVDVAADLDRALHFDRVLAALAGPDPDVVEVCGEFDGLLAVDGGVVEAEHADGPRAGLDDPDVVVAVVRSQGEVAA
jgi:hypothetical protein